MDYVTLYYKKLCEDLQKRIDYLVEAGYASVRANPKPKRPYRPGDSRLDPRSKKEGKLSPSSNFGANMTGFQPKATVITAGTPSEDLKINLPTSWDPSKDDKNRRMISSASRGSIGGLSVGSLGKYSQTYRF